MTITQTKRAPPFPRKTGRSYVAKKREIASGPVLVLPMSSVVPSDPLKSSRLVPRPASGVEVLLKLQPSDVQVARLREISEGYRRALRHYSNYFVLSLVNKSIHSAGSSELSQLKEVSRIESMLSISKELYIGSGSKGLVDEVAYAASKARAEDQAVSEGDQYSKEDFHRWTIHRPSYSSVLLPSDFKSASAYSQRCQYGTPVGVVRAAMWTAYVSEVVHESSLRGYSLNHGYRNHGAQRRFSCLEDLNLKVENGHILEIPAPADREYIELPCSIPSDLIKKSRGSLVGTQPIWSSVFCASGSTAEPVWWCSTDFQKGSSERPGQDFLFSKISLWLKRLGALLESPTDEDLEENPSLKVRFSLLKGLLRY